MLRKKLRLIVTNKKQRDKFKGFACLLPLIGVLWIMSFPYMGSPLFTSENALNGVQLASSFD